MARLADLGWRHRLFLRSYRYRTFDWRPGAVLKSPLAQARVALVTTAAFYTPDQDPFDESIKGGDFSFRAIPTGTDLSTLGIGHKSDAFDPAGVEQDKNLALPIERLQEMAAAGLIGEVNRRHFSFMGSITAPGRLLAESAPAVAELLREDGVGAVLLTPV